MVKGIQGVKREKRVQGEAELGKRVKGKAQVETSRERRKKWEG